jgi:hypothetical protein
MGSLRTRLRRSLSSRAQLGTADAVWRCQEDGKMIEVLVVAIAGTLLLIAAGTGRKPVPVPVRTRKR